MTLDVERLRTYYENPGACTPETQHWKYVELHSALGDTEAASTLDVGCGQGWGRAVFPGGTWTGLDLIPWQIDRARQAYPDDEWWAGEFLVYEFGTRKWDRVLACTLFSVPGAWDDASAAWAMRKLVWLARKEVAIHTNCVEPALAAAMPSTFWRWQLLRDRHGADWIFVGTPP